MPPFRGAAPPRASRKLCSRFTPWSRTTRSKSIRRQSPAAYVTARRKAHTGYAVLADNCLFSACNVSPHHPCHTTCYAMQLLESQLPLCQREVQCFEKCLPQHAVMPKWQQENVTQNGMLCLLKTWMFLLVASTEGSKINKVRERKNAGDSHTHYQPASSLLPPNFFLPSFLFAFIFYLFFFFHLSQ